LFVLSGLWQNIWAILGQIMVLARLFAEEFWKSWAAQQHRPTGEMKDKNGRGAPANRRGPRPGDQEPITRT
jgi:hypothetical protein